MNSSEKKAWDNVTLLMKEPAYSLGTHWSYNFRNDPLRLGFVLARYKFAAKIGQSASSVLELGCSDGIGSSILGETKVSYTGVDLDERAIADAKVNSLDERYRWIHDDFMGKFYGLFDLVVSLDVIEHILPNFEPDYLKTLWENTAPHGIAVVGTPSIHAAPYASKESQLGHVNLFSQERLKEALEGYFHTVFPFGMNDELVHTGFSKMCHYHFCLACNKKEIL